MNCLEFRRAKLSDPRRLAADALAHLAGCAACAAFACEVDDVERALDDALHVPVPEGLADRVVYRARGARPAYRAWALAAGIVLAIALGLSLWNLRPAPSGEYARHAIEHVAMEPESFSTLRNADAKALQVVLQKFGATLKAPLGEVRYIRLCPFEGTLAWHIVFESSEGQATLLLVPGKPLRAGETAAAGGWSALVRPVRTGHYAVVTTSAESAHRFDRKLRENVDWAES